MHKKKKQTNKKNPQQNVTTHHSPGKRGSYRAKDSRKLNKNIETEKGQ